MWLCGMRNPEDLLPNRIPVRDEKGVSNELQMRPVAVQDTRVSIGALLSWSRSVISYPLCSLRKQEFIEKSWPCASLTLSPQGAFKAFCRSLSDD